MISKGMKQKLGIVAAFMHDPEILIHTKMPAAILNFIRRWLK